MTPKGSYGEPTKGWARQRSASQPPVSKLGYSTQGQHAHQGVVELVLKLPDRQFLFYSIFDSKGEDVICVHRPLTSLQTPNPCSTPVSNERGTDVVCVHRPQLTSVHTADLTPLFATSHAPVQHAYHGGVEFTLELVDVLPQRFLIRLQLSNPCRVAFKLQLSVLQYICLCRQRRRL